MRVLRVEARFVFRADLFSQAADPGESAGAACSVLLLARLACAVGVRAAVARRSAGTATHLAPGVAVPVGSCFTVHELSNSLTGPAPCEVQGPSSFPPPVKW